MSPRLLSLIVVILLILLFSVVPTFAGGWGICGLRFMAVEVQAGQSLH